MANFVAVNDDSGRLVSMINIDQIMLITDIGPDGCTLKMDHNFDIKIGPGESARQFLLIVAEHTAKKPAEKT